MIIKQILIDCVRWALQGKYLALSVMTSSQTFSHLAHPRYIIQTYVQVTWELMQSSLAHEAAKQF